jgi:hypothetical protein
MILLPDTLNVLARKLASADGVVPLKFGLLTVDPLTDTLVPDPPDPHVHTEGSALEQVK